MSQIHIESTDLAASAFRLELGGEGGQPNVIALGGSGPLSGTYEQNEKTLRLRSVAADTLAVNELEWRMGDVRISLADPADLEGAFVDGRIPTSAGKREGEKTELVVRAVKGVFDVSLRRGAAEVRLKGVEVVDLELRVSSQEGIRCTASRIDVASCEIRYGGFAATIEKLAAAAVSLSDGDVAAKELSVAEFDVQLPRFVERLPRAAAPASPKEAKGASMTGQFLASTFFDHLHGRVHADVTTDVTVPILGRRRATHRFRIPISHGVLDFRALERNLSFLEDLVIHLKKRKHRLVLEKNIPLLPFDGKPLVFWQLDAEADELAEDNRVRLRTLMHPEVPQERKEEAARDIEKSGRPVALRQLEVGDIDVELRVEGAVMIPIADGALVLGRHSAQTPAISALRVRGELHHRSDSIDAPGEIEIDIEEAQLAFDDVPIAGWRVHVSSCFVTSVAPLRFDFAGLRPRGARAGLRGIELADIRLARG